MTDLRVTTTGGVDIVLKEGLVTAFRQSLRGPLIAPDDAATKRPGRSGMAISIEGPA